MTQTSMKERIREMLSMPTHKVSGLNLDGSPAFVPGSTVGSDLLTGFERYMQAKGMIEAPESVRKASQKASPRPQGASPRHNKAKILLKSC